MFNKFLSENRAVYNVQKYGRARQATDDNTLHALCMLDNYDYIHTHSEYVILSAFPRQQWLRECASVLRYTHIACIL